MNATNDNCQLTRHYGKTVEVDKKEVSLPPNSFSSHAKEKSENIRTHESFRTQNSDKKMLIATVSITEKNQNRVISLVQDHDYVGAKIKIFEEEMEQRALQRQIYLV